MQLPPVPQGSLGNNLLISDKSNLVLQVGDMLHAEVLTVTDTTVAIRMKNTILEARTDLAFRPGENIFLVVEEAGKDIRLRLVRGNSEDTGSIKNTILSALATLKGLKPAADDINALRTAISKMPGSLKELLPELKALENLSRPLDGLSGNVLKSTLRDSGLFFETKLRFLVVNAEQGGVPSNDRIQALMNSDLKAALLSLKSSLNNAGTLDRLLQNGIPPDKLAAAVENLLKNTEFLQLQSKLSDSFQIFVPFVWKDLRDGELIFRESDRDQPGEDAYSCTVNLELERAGRMSARVLLQSGRIYVDVLAENVRFLDVLQTGAELLKSQFETAGIKLGGLNIRHEPKIELKPASAGRLSLRI